MNKLYQNSAYVNRHKNYIKPNDSISFIKNQLDYYRIKASQCEDSNPGYYDLLTTRIIPGCEQTLADLKDYQRLRDDIEGNQPSINISTNQQPLSPGNSGIGNDLDDLSDLPSELKNQLKSATISGHAADIVAVLQEFGEPMEVDQIMIAVYRKSGEVLQRRKLVNQLYRMSKSRLIRSVPKRKGVYSCNEAASTHRATQDFGES